MTTIIECTLLDFDVEKGEWDGVAKPVTCRRAISPSGLPFCDYSLNPYSGCEHGCVYCYAPRMMHRDPSEWRVVGVKTNIVERLSRELPGIKGRLTVGTVTDPYQYAERRFLLTRRCLDVLSKSQMRVTILTKSDLVTRDSTFIREMGADIHMGITTIDDRISKMTEPGAPLPSRRLAAIRTLVGEGVDVKVNIAPVMSTISGHETELAEAIADTGVGKAYVDGLNLRFTDTERLDRMGIATDDESVALVLDGLRERGVKTELFKEFVELYSIKNDLQ